MLTTPTSRPLSRVTQLGTTLLEVLVTIVILSIGLLGLAGIQGQTLIAELESFQRAQAILLMNDMVERISANRPEAASYITSQPLGTGSAATTACSTPPTTQVGRDNCDWGNALLGSSEKKGVNRVGGVVNGVGCVELVTAQDNTPGVCTPGVYRVTVAWQGSNLTSIPSVTCGAGSYGNERYRRAISSQVSIGLPSCQ